MKVHQDDFDNTIGKLDRVLSKMVLWGKDPSVDLSNKQTLKHHAEDMIAAGEKILKDLGSVDGTPQPDWSEAIMPRTTANVSWEYVGEELALRLLVAERLQSRVEALEGALKRLHPTKPPVMKQGHRVGCTCAWHQAHAALHPEPAAGFIPTTSTYAVIQCGKCGGMKPCTYAIHSAEFACKCYPEPAAEGG